MVERSENYAGMHSRELPHVALVLLGTLRVVMDDGSKEDLSRNDVMMLPPGHEAWSIGSEPCVDRMINPIYALTVLRIPPTTAAVDAGLRWCDDRSGLLSWTTIRG
jgi:hypothetical protein